MKLALVVTDNFSTWNFRRGLLRTCAKKGHDTYVLTPSGDYDEHIRQLGVKHIPIRVDRFLNPLRDIDFAFQLYRLFRKHKFDIVHNISIKPNIYGALAARMAGIPTVVGSVTGLGTLFMDEAASYVKALRTMMIPLYRFALSKTDRVWFQNKDDAEFFVSNRLVEAEKVVLIRSSGIDLNEFQQPDSRLTRDELEIRESTQVVTMVSRTLWSKGVEEFIECSKLIGKSFPQIKFLLVGSGEKNNPEAVPPSYLEAQKSPTFRWLGWRTDVPEILSLSDIVVLLTRHREGVPRALLEAMAFAKPIIATDVPGCREVIENGSNGFLVPPRNALAFAEVVERLLKDSAERTRLGAYSRQKVINEFDQAEVNRRILEDLYRVRASNGVLV